MKILKQNNDINIPINSEQIFRTDAGWSENATVMEEEALEKIINPIADYETNRFIHEEYPSPLYTSMLQNDIWYYFYFLDDDNNYVQNYNAVGIENRENALMLKQTTESFFSLEFYKTPDDALPNRLTRRLVFTKNLSLPTGERYFYEPFKNDLFLPVFMGSMRKNTENLYFYWFTDNSVLEDLNLTSNVFWMTAKFYNAKDGSVLDFVNKDISNPDWIAGLRGTPILPIRFYEKGKIGYQVNETTDLYYKVIIDKDNFTYQVYKY